ncbi:formate-dependent phosphoribosylglycinamide formyltransferase [Alteribacillus sp. YIM 98480]|uniref:formate-dependent phosphoribosylglycinamide formyltransferase n=1 Tax=Alteribacillus sp. YIM 98480 TaxID=2606599 RepID=UPI00131B5A26|nr:formate-dependent phosphoribosylglycinamide formyltransferase [Alteribacillus sp. YIM 98480]
MFGAPLKEDAKKIMILGAGELGKEVIIEAQRLGVETIAVDQYEDAPGMQVAHKFYTINMLSKKELQGVIEKEKPSYIVPEIEAIDTATLKEYEEKGYTVIPAAFATKLTMDREGIRELACKELNLPTAKYTFANNIEELKVAVENIGTPCVIKPVMSSSGKGQSICRSTMEFESAWNEAIESGRGKNSRVIVEELIPFEAEITLLTVRSVSGTAFCAPIGHVQKDGDYVESWQPADIAEEQLKEAEEIAKKITDSLGGYGIFGVELFITPERIFFNEVSPRPHDTGMVTMTTQDLSEFALHVRALLGFPIDDVHLVNSGATRTIKAKNESNAYQISGMEKALHVPRTQVRLFGKPTAKPGRRMGVVLSSADTVEAARKKANEAVSYINIIDNHST